MPALYDANKVAVGYAIAYVQPWSASMAAPALPAATSALWTPWATPWKPLGATDDGYSIEIKPKVSGINIEEQANDVIRTMDSMSVQVSASLAEDSMQTLQLAWNGSSIVSVAATPSATGTDTMTLTSGLMNYALGLEMQNYNGLARRIVIPKVGVSSSGTTKYRRSAEKRMYGIDLTALCDPSQISVVDVTPRTGP